MTDDWEEVLESSDEYLIAQEGMRELRERAHRGELVGVADWRAKLTALNLAYARIEGLTVGNDPKPPEA
ncbi:hypothetical protein [Variovorax sp. J22R115]|uniref:hypothetical protein n=1 Tax=Variovorax sp. J22R115 TaxID=3053509 RepID=UPI002578258B|nr:hypothetical protein [Variovorax sp. J22R115]MDM0050592.1 hypothetical protein [Variovorax sp. J22R115]